MVMEISGVNAITLCIVQNEQCAPNVFSAIHSRLLVVAPPLEDRAKGGLLPDELASRAAYRVACIIIL